MVEEAKVMIAYEESVECPFCHERDFDLIGLKHHFHGCLFYLKTNTL
jgi:hypothetical protein